MGHFYDKFSNKDYLNSKRKLKLNIKSLNLLFLNADSSVKKYSYQLELTCQNSFDLPSQPMKCFHPSCNSLSTSS